MLITMILYDDHDIKSAILGGSCGYVESFMVLVTEVPYQYFHRHVCASWNIAFVLSKKVLIGIYNGIIYVGIQEDKVYHYVRILRIMRLSYK